MPCRRWRRRRWRRDVQERVPTKFHISARRSGRLPAHFPSTCIHQSKTISLLNLQVIEQQFVTSIHLPVLYHAHITNSLTCFSLWHQTFITVIRDGSERLTTVTRPPERNQKTRFFQDSPR